MNNVAVVGLGNIAHRHRENVRLRFPHAKIFSTSASGRNVQDSIEHCDVFCITIDDLIKNDLDFVIVASPASHHIIHSLPFVENNIPVLIEKPLATNLSEVVELIKLRDEVNGIVSVAYCLRYCGVLIELNRLIKKNYFGKIHHVNLHVGQDLRDWRPTKSINESVSANKNLGGGVLNELSHELDYMFWMFGEVKPLFSKLSYNQRYIMDVEDMADVVLQTSNGAVITLHLDFLQQSPQRYCQLITETGRVDVNILDQTINFYNGMSINCIYDNSKESANHKYLRMLDDFVANIRGKDNSCITLEDARETVKLIQAIRLSDLEK